jgi:hypothetical protein
MSLTWSGVKDRIDRHRQKYPGSSIRCPTAQEWEMLVFEKGAEGMNQWYQDMIGQIVEDERILTPRVIVVRRKPKQEG